MNKLYFTLMLLLSSLTIFAQSPEKMSYQSVIRDGNNNLVVNQQVGQRVSILQGAITGVAVYIETHVASTNANALLSLEIGTGTVVAGDFSTIDWSNGPYFIKTETDPTGGTNYSITGTSQLMSVPYALHAKSATTALNVVNDQVDDADADPNNELQVISISNDTVFLSDGGFAHLPTDGHWVVQDTNLYNGNTGNVGVGTSTPTEKLEVAGNAKVEGLQVGPGNLFKNMQGGKVLVGQSGGQALIFVNVTFPAAFDNPPNIICTAANEPGTIYDDSYNITVRFVTTTGFQMVVNRVDGTTWGQEVEAFWMAFE